MDRQLYLLLKKTWYKRWLLVTTFGCVVRWLYGWPIWARNHYDPGYSYKSISLSTYLKMLVKHTDTFCSTYCWLHYSCSFPMHWPSLTSYQPDCLASIMAKSIWQHLVWHSSPAAMGFLDAQCNCLALYQIHHLPGNCLCWHFDSPRHHSSLANVLCPKCFQVHCPHHFRLNDTWLVLFGRY